MNDKKYIAYYRVSTQKQGQSGLGLEAQKAAVHKFVQCESCILQEFVEIETGKKNNRPELQKALALAKETGCTLVIAKLDRLSRNLSFISALMEANIKFVCADMPDANSFTIHIFAALAQQEAELISKRTKAALAAKKAQGAKLGKPENLSQKAREKAAEKKKQAAIENERSVKAAEMGKALRSLGKTFEEIADFLNQKGFQTPTGKGAWNRGTIARVMKRYA